ncbi:MAG: peptidyl-prolyl cis-trans isomerase [Prevotella sp.]|nr:peptidyl-prolyl cis-trans isomerase [Prevotella sp.]
MSSRFAQYCSVFASVVMLAAACSDSAAPVQDTGEQALVSVGNRTLYKHELNEVISGGLSPADSTLAAEAYIKMWVKNELMYEKAKANLLDKVQIDELVDNYRHSLTIYTYQEQLLKERLSKEITDKELREYYEANPDRFKLETNIIKGLFLKVPVSSPRLEDLRKWYFSTSEKAIENIEKYSLENAVIYDYFYNKWVDFDDVMDNIPREIDDRTQFLKERKRLEVQDSAYVYLLNIKEYALVGSKAPFEFAKGQILDILVGQRRESFMKKFEEDLYENAIADDKVRFYEK